jgi:hypothetical protein
MSSTEVVGGWEVKVRSSGGLRRDLRVTVREGSEPGAAEWEEEEEPVVFEGAKGFCWRGRMDC